MTRFRLPFAWLFLLATVVAQGPHDHREAEAAVSGEFGECDEAGRHWAGHDEADAHAGPDGCPLCHHRADPMAAPPAPSLLRSAGRPCTPPPDRVLRDSHPTFRIRCRAPPRG